MLTNSLISYDIIPDMVDQLDILRVAEQPNCPSTAAVLQAPSEELSPSSGTINEYKKSLQLLKCHCIFQKN